jgi:hypothetical protein
MVLCKACQKIDIREILQVSLKFHDNAGLPALKELIVPGSQVQCETNKKGLTLTLRHHESVLAIRDASQNGCKLCTIIWEQLRMKCWYKLSDVVHWGRFISVLSGRLHHVF